MSRRNDTLSTKYSISSPRPVNAQMGHDASASMKPPHSTQYPEGSRAPPPRSSNRPAPVNVSPVRPARSRLRAQSPEHTSSNTRWSQNDDSKVEGIVDPFAFDRSQRIELRAQAAVQPALPTGRLANAVGAFISAGRSEPQRPVKSRARQRRDQSWDFKSDRTELDVILNKVHQAWPFVFESDFSSSTLALDLLSDSGSSHSLRHFLQVYDDLSLALQSAVQMHFQSFAASLPAHSTFVSTLDRAQQSVKGSKNALLEARNGFAIKGKAELAGIKAREKTVRDMLGILDSIEVLKSVPDMLETLIGEKRYHEAAVLLVQNIKTSQKPELVRIGSLSDLRAYFKAQEATLADIVIEDLQAHLYLKTEHDYLFETAHAGRQAESPPEIPSIFQQYLQTLSMRSTDTSEIATRHDDSKPGPYSSIESLMETLAVLDKLEPALEIVLQRAASELYQLVEVTLDEVEERSRQREQDTLHPINNTRHELSTSNFLSHTLGRPPEVETLRDIFWTVYAKFNTVLKGYRVTYEMCRLILARPDSRSAGGASSELPILDLWRAMQHEIHRLLHDYLADAGRTDGSGPTVAAVNDVLKMGSVRGEKPIFKFVDADARNPARESLNSTLQATLQLSAPGLLNTQVHGETTGQVDGFDAYASRGDHRRLVTSSPFNISTLFQPTLAFVERACQIIPPEFDEEPKNVGGMLEDFVVKTFLPCLDAEVTAAFQSAVSGHDASDIDVSVANTGKPPQNSATRVLHLVHSLCDMLEATPFHRENYSRLIVGTIVQYYQQCSSQYRELCLNGSELALPALWAQREDIIACLTEVRGIKADSREELEILLQKEVRLLTEVLGKSLLTEGQLIGSSRKLVSLCALAQSLRWFIDSLLDLEQVGDAPVGADMGPRLPLTQAMAQRFEAIVQTYEQLAELVVNTIRLEMRGRLICNLGASLRKGEYWLESEAFEPDPDITELCRSVSRSYEIIEGTLEHNDASFIFRGLGVLADHLFVTSASRLGAVNAEGVNKIQRNIQAIQQVLSSISGGLLTKSMSYWHLYHVGPKAMLEDLRIAKPRFSFDDYNTMLNLQCRTRREEAPSSELNTYLIDLHALAMSIEGWEIGE